MSWPLPYLLVDVSLDIILVCIDEFDSCYAYTIMTKEGIIKLGQFVEESKIDVLVNNAGEYLYTPVLEGFEFDKIDHITYTS